MLTYGQLQAEAEEKLKNLADNPREEFDILSEHVFNMNRLNFFMRANENIEDSKKLNQFWELLSKRLSGMPVQYVVNKAYFLGLELYVDEAVLIPRPETEEMTVFGERLLSERVNALGVLDLCTGSGAIGVYLAKNHPNWSVLCSDISEAALKVAAKNGEGLSNIRFMQSDLFEGLDAPTLFDLIISNPPYIPTMACEQLDPKVKDYEPILALDGGDDGFDLVKKIIQSAPTHLKHGAYLLIEMDETHSALALAEADKAGYQNASVLKDAQGKERFFFAQKK